MHGIAAVQWYQPSFADTSVTPVLTLDSQVRAGQTCSYLSHVQTPLSALQWDQPACAKQFCFGGAVWEMYTGSSLFKGLTVGQVFFMVVYESHRPAIPEDCPEAFVSLMTSCWSTDPADR